MLAKISITNSLQQGFDKFFGYIPNIIGFLVILIIGYILAKVIKGVVNKALLKLKVDERLQATTAGEFVDKVSPGGRPSRLIGGLVFWIIFLYVITAAVAALKIPSVTNFMNKVLAYLPNVIAAVLIFVIAAVIAGALATLATKMMGDTPTGKLATAVVPGLVMAIAVFMILNQLKIATAIVTITYAALLGMLALTGALAFGLGGRDVAGRIWADTYDKSQSAKAQASQDLNKGKQRAGSALSSDPGSTPPNRPRPL